MEFPDCTKIASTKIEIVPRYNETDKGGIVHNRTYAIYWEIGRTEILRVNGVAYADLENAGIFFVVAELSVKYRRPAFYDEKLRLKVECSEVTAAKIVHKYQLFRKSTGEMIAEGSTTIACVDRAGKIRRIPEFMYPE
jgi:acyl-CoA thioester hydrolase